MPPAFGDTAAALIVDDDAQVSAVFARLLGAEGYRCTSAASAAEARERLLENDFAIALVDIMMPGESGLELSSHMLAEHPDLAVIMVTGIEDPSIADLVHPRINHMNVVNWSTSTTPGGQGCGPWSRSR